METAINLRISFFKADCVDHNKLWEILKEMEIPDHLTCLLRNLYTGQEVTELNMEQWAGSKLGKEYIKAVYCHPAYLTYMQGVLCVCAQSCPTLCNCKEMHGLYGTDSSVHGIFQAIILEWVAISYSRGSTPPRNQTHVSCISLIGLHLLHWLTDSLPQWHLGRPICRVHHAKCWAGWITSWNKDSWEKYQQPQICRWYHPNGWKWRGTKEALDDGERGEWKSWLKIQHSKN